MPTRTTVARTNAPNKKTAYRNIDGIPLYRKPDGTFTKKPPIVKTGDSSYSFQIQEGGEKLKAALKSFNKKRVFVKVTDAVSHPAHYTSGKIEVWDFIADQGLNYLLGNTVKYICRAGKKDPAKTLEDLQKAQAYLNRQVHFLKSGKPL